VWRVTRRTNTPYAFGGDARARVTLVLRSRAPGEALPEASAQTADLGSNVIGQYPGRVLDLHGEAGQGSSFLDTAPLRRGLCCGTDMTETRERRAIERCLTDGAWHEREEIILRLMPDVNPAKAQRRASRASRLQRDRVIVGARQRVQEVRRIAVMTGVVEQDDDRYRTRPNS
jgi:hypothetical protein